MTAPTTATNPRRRGRKLHTGRYDTREELERHVLHDWLKTELCQSAIAQRHRTTYGVVSRILNGPKPPGVDQD